MRIPCQNGPKGVKKLTKEIKELRDQGECHFLNCGVFSHLLYTIYHFDRVSEISANSPYIIGIGDFAGSLLFQNFVFGNRAWIGAVIPLDEVVVSLNFGDHA